MAPNLKPYSSYKPSGIPWLGDIPAHWEVTAVKKRYAIQLGKMLQNRPNNPDDVEVPYLKAQHVQWFHVRTIDAPKMWASQNDTDQFGIAPGDLLVCEGGEGGRCGILKQKVSGYIIQNALHRVRPRDQSRNDFLQYVMSAIAATGWFDALNDKATIAHFTKEKFGALRVPFPPLSEQTAIVRYLAHADERIRRYVSGKQKLIRLLEEEKQAVIHRAVTRGLDPNVRLKPSGVEGLGDVPAHWEVGPVKRAFLSMDYGISESASDSGTIRLLTMAHLNNGQVTVPPTGGVDSVNPYLLLQKDDLLFNRTNSQELVGKVGLFTGHDSPVTFASYLVRMRPCPNHDPVYLNMALNDTSFISRARREAIPSLHQSNLNPTRYGRLHIVLPPRQEQQTILRVLRNETRSLRDAISRTRRQIELLQEYRTRLIADVVTGQVDVRAAGGQVP